MGQKALRGELDYALGLENDNRDSMSTTILSLLSSEAAADFRAKGWWQDTTIYGYAAAHAKAMPDAIAIRDRFRVLTWRELVAAIDRAAAELWHRGVRRGQRVVFWMPDRIESVVLLIACSRNGYVCCPSPHRNHTVDEVAAMIERLKAAAFYYQAQFGSDAATHDIARRLDGLGYLRHVERLAPAGEADRGRQPFENAGGQAAPSPETDANRVVYLAFTSGSTGRPKGVMHSDNSQLVTARAISRDWKVGRQSVVCTLSPFSHNLGVGSMLTALVGGAEFVIHDTPRGASIVDRLVETGVTYLVGVPTHALDLVNELRQRGLTRLGKVTGFRVSGAASPPQVLRDLTTFGITPQSGYGMTENNAHQYTHPGDGIELITGSVGRACEGYEVAIVDPDNVERQLPAGEIGLVVGRGASLMLGYWDDQAATEQSFNSEGWFLTGDLGKLDANGYLTITGRKKEVIIRGGHNINPAQIEDLAMGHGAIARVAVVPIADARLGERICLVLTWKPQAAHDVGDVIRYLSGAGLSRYELPEFWLQLEHMPLMANGKINKTEILAAIAGGRDTPIAVGAAKRGE